MAKLINDPPFQSDVVEKDAQGRFIKLDSGWLTWFAAVSRNINRQQGRKLPYPQIRTLMVGASPWVYQDNVAGDSRVLISGGTVSKIEVGWDGVTYYNTGVTAGQITLSQSDFLRITYTVAPTVVTIPA